MSLGGFLLRSLARPLAAARRLPALSPPLPPPPSRPLTGGAPTFLRGPWLVLSSSLHTSTSRHLVDTRLPKRRPGLAPRKKRAALRPRGPFAWIQSVPGEPVPTSQPNEGSIKSRGRKEKKRIRQRRDFIAILKESDFTICAASQKFRSHASPISASSERRTMTVGEIKQNFSGEVKKRKAAFAEHKQKKRIERIDRKMAAVAREKAWAQRLIELQQLEEARKAAQDL